jgi:hypothetical protein
MIVMHYGIAGLSSLMIKSMHFVAKDFYLYGYRISGQAEDQ